MKVIYHDATGRGAMEIVRDDAWFTLEPGAETDLPDDVVTGRTAETDTVDGVTYIVRCGVVPLIDQFPDIEIVKASSAPAA